MRRRTRSSTSDSEIPNSAKVCGIAGLKADRTGAKRSHGLRALSCDALSAETLSEFTGCTLGQAGSSNPLVRFIYKLGVFLGIAAMGCGADFAESLYKAGQKAERAGDTLHAYLLYARAAALAPSNINYAERKFALQIQTTGSVRQEMRSRSGI